MSRKTIIIIAAIIILGFSIYQGVFRKEKSHLNLAEVTRTNLIQEVSETGQVKKGESVNLSFKSSGLIEKIYVAVGETVKAGDLLAKLKSDDLAIQLQQAKAGLSLTQAQLDKLLAGASQEEIQVSQTKVENSQIVLDTANQNLADAYENGLNALNDVYLKSYNAQNAVDLIQRTYFAKNDQEGLRVKENQNNIVQAVSQIKSVWETAKTTNANSDIESALSRSETELAVIADALKIIRETCEEPNYQAAVSSTDKTSLDTQRTNINTALTNVISSRQTITAKKLAVDTAKGALKTAQDELNLKIAPARPEDISLYQAQVAEAQAKVQLLESQIQDTKLKSPVAGEIIDIKKEVGELVQASPSDVAITLLPAVPFEIETNIYEEDVVKIAIGNPVSISLVAWSDQIFTGKVISINPAEKIIDGVVYYQVDSGFDVSTSSALTDLKPGMTADITIKTAEKNDVLVVPGTAVAEKNGRSFVSVWETAATTTEREIQVGIKGNDNLVEVILGLEAGEKIVLPE